MISAVEELYQGLVAQGYGESLVREERLARHTSFAIGGPTDLFVVARTPGELAQLARMGWDCGIPVLILGRGTNILVADAGLRGMTIANRCCRYSIDEHGLLRAESGIALAVVAKEAVGQGWAGLEWAVGIPGTVGGAVVGNAGAYGGCIADHLGWVRLLRANGSVEQVQVDWLEYGYRSSRLKRGTWRDRRTVVLEAGFYLTPGDPAELARKVGGFAEQRRMRTPEGFCAGSIFKRTMQYPAGFLIEQVGLKGKQIGGAGVSPKHANFLMNMGGATAADVKALIRLVQDQVWSRFAQRLEPEIEFVGEWDEG